MLQSILMLIIDTIASILGGVFLLRFWMQAVRVRPPASIAQFTYQLSDWFVRPLRRVLPGMGGYDWASFVGAFLVILLSVTIGQWLAGAFSPQIIAVLSMLRLLEWVFYGFMGLIIIGAILSWVNPHAPLAPFINALSDPLMRPLRRIFPLIGNIDLTPLIALILLRIALQLISALIVAIAPML